MPNRSFVGGPKVHFGDSAESEEFDESKFASYNFERHDTPHPKPHSNIAAAPPKGVKKHQGIDGHLVPRMEAHQPTTTLVLTKKVSADQTNNPSMPASALPQQQKPGPRSALKHSSANIYETNDLRVKVYRRLNRSSTEPLDNSITWDNKSTD